MTDLVGTKDIAERLGVKFHTVQTWRRRRVFMLAPVRYFGPAPVWYWSDVEQWAWDTGRLT